MLLVLLLVVAAALVGGLRVALPGAVAGGLILNWFFTPPFGTLVVDRPDQLLVLGVYLAVATSVSVVVDVSARRTSEAARARAEAQALATLAGATLEQAGGLPALLDRVRTIFGVGQVALLYDNGTEVATSGSAAPDAAEVRVRAGHGLVLAVRGPELFAEDRRLLASFADAAASALEARRLTDLAATAAQLEAADALRTALLTAVGHDLRTPLAGIKAGVSSLRQTDVTWSDSDRDALLQAVEESTDRLQGIVANLLDASRLQAGAVSVALAPAGLAEVVARALVGTAHRDRIHLEVGEDLPDVLVDAGLLERVLANLTDNALRHAPAGTIVTVRGRSVRDAVICEVVDHGLGVAEQDWPRLFAPFQRLGDRGGSGVGLGLVVARGFTEAMGGTLRPLATSGGGVTMRLELVRA